MCILGKICVCIQSNVCLYDHTDEVSGRKRLEIQRNWKGKGPSTIIQHNSTAPEWTHLVHRIKVDELAGYIMTTSNKGGLLVTDMNEDRILWALPRVCRRISSLPFIYN